MKLREIQKLISSITVANTKKVTLKTKEFKITVTKDKKDVCPVHTDTFLVASHPLEHTECKTDVENEGPQNNISQIKSESDFILVKSPFVGTFHMNEQVISPCFKRGDVIKEGDELCVIESLKLRNKIKSKMSGKIDKIFVENSTPVEFDQPLFLIHKNSDTPVVFNV